MLAIGQNIGRYRVVRALGHGGMSAVFEATEERGTRRAAIKVQRPVLTGSLALSQRLLNEARWLHSVKHPGLVEVYEWGSLPLGEVYLIMEYLEGETLYERMVRLGNDWVRPRAIGLARQIALALAASHREGLVHRDLKPENVMIVADPARPGSERIKVIDFGLATRSQPSAAGVRWTGPGMSVGTPAYMAPEQCVGRTDVDGKADVYSLGVVLFELITGTLPFFGEQSFDMMRQHVRTVPPRLRALAPDTSAGLDELVAAMLTKDPARRPSMDRVAHLLLGLGAEEDDPTAPLRPPVRRRAAAAPAWADAVVVTATLAALAFGSLEHRLEGRRRGPAPALHTPAPVDARRAAPAGPGRLLPG